MTCARNPRDRVYLIFVLRRSHPQEELPTERSPAEQALCHSENKCDILAGKEQRNDRYMSCSRDDGRFYKFYINVFVLAGRATHRNNNPQEEPPVEKVSQE